MNLNDCFSRNPVAMDAAHIMLIHGLVLAHKPIRVLELGVGTGMVTRAILSALKFNGVGILTSIDNWFDHNIGAPDPRKVVDEAYRDYGMPIHSGYFFNCGEREVVTEKNSNFCDMLISDADHQHSHEWLDDHLRILKPGGIFIAHDVENRDFPNLATIPARLKHLPNFVFDKSSRPDERCGRGLIVARKQK